LQDVVTDVSADFVAVVLEEKSGFPSTRLVDMGMSVVSVLTGQHNLWGEEKMKSPMKSMDIFISFAARIKKVMGRRKGKEKEGEEQEEEKEEEEEEEEGEEEEEKGPGEAGKGGLEEVELEGRGKPVEVGKESGIEEEES
jgi:flagellar biosynthesis/type III secretory pathway M-ring protein FliF/YscJ